MLDAKYPLSGFDDVNFDDSGGPLSGLDESEIGRRLSGGSLLNYHGSVTTPVTSHSRNKGDESESEAAFSGALETNVTASLGQTAFLRCRLKNSKHQVSNQLLYYYNYYSRNSYFMCYTIAPPQVLVILSNLARSPGI
jgi:hypothetical protein